MADAKAEVKDDVDLRKKCAQTGVNLKRKKRYYRNGRYFITKAAFKVKAKTDKESADKAKEAAKQ